MLVANGDRMSLRTPTCPLLRLPRVVVPCDVLQRFLAGRFLRLDNRSSSNNNNHSSSSYLGAVLHDRPQSLTLIVSCHLSALSESHVRQLRRKYFQLTLSKAPTSGGMATARPLGRASGRKFPDTDSEEEEGPWEDEVGEEDVGEKGVGRREDERQEGGGEVGEAASDNEEGEELGLPDEGGKEEDKAEPPELEVCIHSIIVLIGLCSLWPLW